MFTPLILACTIDASFCTARTSSRLFNTEEECLFDLEQGFMAIAQNGMVVVEGICYYWNSPIFDEQL